MPTDSMSLKQLHITQFRNLHDVKIDPHPGLNLITGPNAAGKTSLLESIFYLSYGRSFRSAQARDLINFEAALFRLVAKLDDNTGIGIEKSTREQRIRINQHPVHRISELSALLPVIALHPDSHQLVSAGPELRRQFLDWGVFHVEHTFIKTWKDFRKALAQRNAALRHGESARICNLWNSPLVENAEKIEQARRAYLERLQPILDRNTRFLFPGSRVSLHYRKGWPEDQAYKDQLEATLDRDRDKGYTQAGPHRAEIRIRLDDQSVQTAVSRGQQKKLVALLKLSQLELFNETSDKTCVLLYDDLPAELDGDNRGTLMQLLASMKVQLFITAIESDSALTSHFEQYRLFHVEHGRVKVWDS